MCYSFRRPARTKCINGHAVCMAADGADGADGVCGGDYR